MKRLSRRGQFEILGVAIFIVIVIIGIVIFVMLPNDTVEDPAAAYEVEQLSQTLVDTMVRVQIGPQCVNQPDATFYDLMRDVTIVRQGICVDADILDPDGIPVTSKQLLEKSAKTMIEAATASKYEFEIYLASAAPNDPPIIEGPPAMRCPPRVRRERIGEERIPLVQYGETVIIRLQLCGVTS